MTATATQHTPGPWEIDQGSGFVIPAAGGGMVAEAAGDNEAQREANAKLIAAAPNLQQACQYALNHLRATDNPAPDQVQARERQLVAALEDALRLSSA